MIVIKSLFTVNNGVCKYNSSMYYFIPLIMQSEIQFIIKINLYNIKLKEGIKIEII